VSFPSETPVARRGPERGSAPRSLVGLPVTVDIAPLPPLTSAGGGLATAEPRQLSYH